MYTITQLCWSNLGLENLPYICLKTVNQTAKVYICIRQYDLNQLPLRRRFYIFLNVSIRVYDQ